MGFLLLAHREDWSESKCAR